MKESGINRLCDQGERIVLPRLSDVVASALEVFRNGGTPAFLAIDIRDAFHNIPAGTDKAYTAAMVPMNGNHKIVVYDVLVCGSVSSPTLWGRYAAWLGRTLAAVCPEVACQVYVDDPIFVFDRRDPRHVGRLGKVLLWIAVTGFPLKLEKSDAGSKVKWIGATIEAREDDKTVVVSIPEDKINEYTNRIKQFLSKPVIGKKQLRSLAGGRTLLRRWRSASNASVPRRAVGYVARN